jgi:hypothetical protein
MTERQDDTTLTGILKQLVDECQNPARLIELLYWSAEPDLAEIMRHYIGLSPERRAALYAFLLLVKVEPGAATVRIAENGEMTFSSPAVAELARKIVDPRISATFLH